MITRLRCVLAAALLASGAAAHADTRLWYDPELNPVDDPAAAAYHVRVEDQRDGIGWPAELRRIEDDALKMRGYVAQPEPGDTDVTWIGHYELYRMAGEHRLKEVGTADAHGRYQGLISTFDDDGKLNLASLYRDGELDGKSRQYLHGNLYSVTDYANGQREGVHAQYLNGTLRRIEEYHDGELDGVAEQYSVNDHAALTSRSEYSAGKPDGWFRQYQAGQTVSEIHYVDGKKDGPERYWHDQGKGQLREIAHYRAGQQIGERIINRYDVNSRVTVKAVFDADDNLLAKTEYDNGKPTTRVRHLRDGSTPQQIHDYFDSNGYVEVRRISFPGQPRETELRFAADGALTYRRELHDHHRVGRYFERLEPGHTVEIQYDANGKRHGKQIETRDGEVIKMTHWAHGERHGAFFELAYNGHRTEGTYVDGQLDGVVRVLDDDQPVEITHYDHGTKDGAYARYRSHGELRAKGRYVAGNKDGAWIETSRLGKTWHGPYDQGNKTGKWQAFDDRGHVIAQGRFDDQGERTGLWSFYGDTGKLEDCPLYRKGKRVAFPNYDHRSGQTMVEYCKSQTP